MQNTSETTAVFPDEIAHLEQVTDRLDRALAAAEENAERTDKEYMDMKRYMVENRGEIDGKEMFQSDIWLKHIDNSVARVAITVHRLQMLKGSPYFARIDFRAAAEDKTESFYIGRFAFFDDDELMITDWRAPVAGMFYDNEVGPAAYNAPIGRIDGELTLKRQFKIQGGVMVYAIESSMNIQDSILQQELSQTSDEKMKSIIATIQREQNEIIRDEQAGTMIIQGVAGSGKTSIALHRIAFLLYRFKNRLSADNVLILSPNKVFGDYISNVLPELGEEPVAESSFMEIAAEQLGDEISFQDASFEIDDEAWRERVRFKSTLSFVKLLDDFIDQIPELVFQPEQIKIGVFYADADLIGTRFATYSKHPVKRRIDMIADEVHTRFKTDYPFEDNIPRRSAVMKALGKMLKIKSTLALYKEFYKRNAIPRMFKQPARGTLEWADVYPYLYLRAAFEGLRETGNVRHLIVDEMQDYTPIQYALINRLFKCQKTILGDYGQLLNVNHRHSLEDIRLLYPDSRFAELTKSYRSTYEIISLARRIKAIRNIEAIERHGDVPGIIGCFDLNDELTQIKKGIDEFLLSGFVSLGIITKTETESERLFGLLGAEYDVHRISPDSTGFINGISVTSIRMSKGLEFDSVIIPGVSGDNYGGEFDRSLLYIACTRAMHKLTILHVGEPSPILGENSAPEYYSGTK